MTVRTGLEVAMSDPGRFGLASGARVGLVAHPASVDADLRHAVGRLAESGLRLVRLFGPEHGIGGEAQDMEPVDGRRETGGPEEVSLYGEDESSLKPRREHLADLDAVVVDLQDVGSRYYTYVYTLAYVMETAAEVGVPVVVFDRPNPIGGRITEGPVLEERCASFVGRYPIPVRHGLTAGELARLFRERFGIDAALTVVPMEGWRRAMQFEDTGLPWVLPSPNMPTPDTARVYPGGCLIEGTNLSEGRGTTRPFEWLGAPWLDAPALARRLDDLRLPAVAFRACAFRPGFQKFAGQTCAAIQVHPLDPVGFRPFLTYLTILAEIRRLHPDRFDWRREPYEFVDDRLAIDLLLGRSELRQALEAGVDPLDLERGWSEELDAFDGIRDEVRLYGD